MSTFPPLGILSQKYEVGNRGPETVSSGKGDPGGVSYGLYQMTSKPGGGTVKMFIRDPDFPWKMDFSGKTPGFPDFSNAWKALAKREPDAFAREQHAYIEKTHYLPLVENVWELTGEDFTHRTNALQQVAWSVAVQHGASNGAHLISRAYNRVDDGELSDISDQDIINAIYDERAKENSRGELAYFSRSSLAVQKALRNRFDDERRDALEMLESERTIA